MTTNLDMKVLEHKLAQYKERDVFQVKLGLTDIDGVMRGKYVGLDKFASLLTKQGGFFQSSQGKPLPDASAILRRPWRSNCSSRPSKIRGTRSGP